MSPRVRYFALLALLTAGLLGSVLCLQYILHVGSCGNGPNSLAQGFGRCPGGIVWKVLGLVAGLGVAVACVVALPGPSRSLAFGLGFAMLGAMFAILGFVPAPGEHGTALGLAIGAPFLLGGLVAFGFVLRR